MVRTPKSSKNWLYSGSVSAEHPAVNRVKGLTCQAPFEAMLFLDLLLHSQNISICTSKVSHVSPITTSPNDKAGTLKFDRGLCLRGFSRPD